MLFSAIQDEYASTMPAADTKKFRISLIEREEGFTLNEILVAIALIVIGVLGFSVNTIGVIQGNFISNNVTVATSLAQDKLEELKAPGTFTNVSNCSSPPDHLTAVGASGGIYDRCWIISDRADLGAGLKEIDVTVSWRDYISRSVTLSTLVYTG